MLLIYCPYCEKHLPELEFAHAGEAHIARPASPDDQSDEQWAEFLFLRSNVRGVHYERWRHVHGCGRFFNAARDTVSDRFLVTYKVDALRPPLNSLTGEDQ